MGEKEEADALAASKAKEIVVLQQSVADLEKEVSDLQWSVGERDKTVDALVSLPAPATLDDGGDEGKE